MTIERPMFPPRADSVDSFSHHPGIGQPESRNLASDSRKPVERLSRRNVLAGLVVLPIALPATFAAVEPDPVYAAMEHFKQLSVEYTAAVERSAPLLPEDPNYCEAIDVTGDACDVLFEQMDVIFTFRPSTIAGAAALLKYISTLEEWQMSPGLEDGEGKKNVQAFCGSLAIALETIICQQAVQS
jgi:hypothetical protein